MTKNRVTSGQIDKMLDDAEVQHHVFHGKETIACFKLENGFTVTGRSACVDPANFDGPIGRLLAREDAKRQLWSLEGYRLQCALHCKATKKSVSRD